MRALLSPLTLVIARGRRRPARWLPAVIGIALATAFGAAIAGEATIAGDQAARAVLRSATPLARTVRLTAQGFAEVDRSAREILASAGITRPTRVTVLGAVRLDGMLVRMAAIEPLARWLTAPVEPGPCTTAACPMIAAAPIAERALRDYGVDLRITATGTLRSPVPLGFTAANGGPPLLLSGDPAGLGGVAGLSGVYRTQSWLGVLPLSGLHSWQIAAVRDRLQRTQARLSAAGTFTLSAPFGVLDRARAAANAAPKRLLLAGGGALAALAAFLILAAYALRHERAADVARLRIAGASSAQRVIFAVGEAATLSAIGLAVGALLGVVATALLAGHADLPVGPILSRGLETAAGAGVLIAGWLVATAIVTLVLLLRSARIADLLAVAALAALALTLTRGASAGGTLPTLLAPLGCLSAGVLVYRLAVSGLRWGERLSRRGPPMLRLALVGLARAPAAPALAIAFLTVCTGLGGFALSYRATLLRGDADAAADRVPLDALVAPGPSFATPLTLAPLARWQGLAGGPVLPVRRTDASYPSGGLSVTVPALGVPAAGLPLIHGWRASDGSLPLTALAKRLRPPGPVRVPGPVLTGARELELPARSSSGAVELTADLRDPSGTVTQVVLGSATGRAAVLRARLPRGIGELEALTLTEPSGLEATNGHQNAENPAAATQQTIGLTLGQLTLVGPAGRRTVKLAGWRAVGAAQLRSKSLARLSFTTSGSPGVLRPEQPSDHAPVPVLTDPATAASSAGGQLPLTVDGLPVPARIVGVLKRFPTLPDGSAGFVVADQATLGSALDASLPGQGRPDELWIGAPHPERLEAALGQSPLDGLSASFRSSLDTNLRGDTVARAILGALIAATVTGIALAMLGLLVALVGTLRDPRVERELTVYGLGRPALRRELRLRVLIAGASGVVAGAVLTLALTRLAVATVTVAANLSPPPPPLVTVAPWGALAIAALATLVVLGVAAWLASTAAVGRGESR